MTVTLDNSSLVYQDQDFTFTEAITGTNEILSIILGSSGSTGSVAFKSVHWSFAVAPTAPALLTISDGSTTYSMYITASGPGFMPFDGIAFGDNLDVTVALAAAGGVGAGSSLAVIGVRIT